MVKEPVRKCSHCGHNGHNARSCTGKGFRLFGVPILLERGESSIKKSKSTGNLIACNRDHIGVDAGYLSDGQEIHRKKRGLPWTEDEHLSFLTGLEKLGKGAWKGISMNYVHSRTATQVASHAQKYFIRLATTDKKNRRSSLFDMSLIEPEIRNPPPPEPPDRIDEISQQADKSLADTQQQSKIALASAVPPVVPLSPGYGVPDFRQMPYIPMVEVASNGQSFPGTKSFSAIPSVPVMYFPNPAYFYLPKSPGSQPSNSVLLPPPPHGSSPKMRP